MLTDDPLRQVSSPTLWSQRAHDTSKENVKRRLPLVLPTSSLLPPSAPSLLFIPSPPAPTNLSLLFYLPEGECFWITGLINKVNTDCQPLTQHCVTECGNRAAVGGWECVCVCVCVCEAQLCLCVALRTRPTHRQLRMFHVVIQNGGQRLCFWPHLRGRRVRAGPSGQPLPRRRSRWCVHERRDDRCIYSFRKLQILSEAVFASSVGMLQVERRSFDMW